MDAPHEADDTLDVSHLPEPETHPLWPHILEALESAAEDDPFDPAVDVLWAAYDDTFWGFATTRLRADGAAELRCVAGQRFREWGGPMEAMICRWARECGATTLQSQGRCGWVRLARTFGWVRSGTNDAGQLTFTKEL